MSCCGVSSSVTRMSWVSHHPQDFSNSHQQQQHDFDGDFLTQHQQHMQQQKSFRRKSRRIDVDVSPYTIHC